MPAVKSLSPFKDTKLMLTLGGMILAGGIAWGSLVDSVANVQEDTTALIKTVKVLEQIVIRLDREAAVRQSKLDTSEAINVKILNALEKIARDR